MQTYYKSAELNESTKMMAFEDTCVELKKEEKTISESQTTLLQQSIRADYRQNTHMRKRTLV